MCVCVWEGGVRRAKGCATLMLLCGTYALFSMLSMCMQLFASETVCLDRAVGRPAFMQKAKAFVVMNTGCSPSTLLQHRPAPPFLSPASNHFALQLSFTFSAKTCSAIRLITCAHPKHVRIDFAAVALFWKLDSAQRK